MRRRWIVMLAVLATALTALPAGAAPDRASNRELPESLSEAKLSSPIQSTIDRAALDELRGLTGPQQVLIRLAEPSVAQKELRGSAAAAAKGALRAEQVSLENRVLALDPSAEIIASTQLVLNAVFARVDAGAIESILADPAVARVVPVANYELDLDETVPLIGGDAVQADGFDGAGVSVAVLDSGIDYTHANLGGSGDPAEYAANDPTIIEPGTFPTAKVVGGYDFVGSDWPDSPEAPDPDPIDDGPQAGHGTHVADIIGGVSGVAPGADLYGVKVCSSVSTSCSGIALIQGMEFAVDPDGDGDPSDAVDIINMSLGSDYGQPFDDDLSLAVENATALGVLTVSSAGNGGDKPYVTGSPSSAPTALAVAQTQVPSAGLQLIEVNGTDYPAVFQPWSAAPAEVITGPVQYGDGAGGNLEGCAPFAPGSLSGLIVLVDRGACNFTLKIKNVNDAGGLVGIIGLVAPGDPFSGGDGGDRPIDIPGYMIGQADSNAIKAAISGGETSATVDPANQLPLIGQMVGSSSRGPQHEGSHLVKPEIGAPGASVSAVAGTGDGEGAFGGTSGASPMVAGSAALLMQASPDLAPLEVKAVLMNTGETDIDTDPFAGLAPITRIGGGEVRVDKAIASPAAAWDDDGAQGALSFGYVEVTDDVTLRKTVRVRNYSDQDITYDINPTFRYADDQASGAVSVDAPSSVRVRAGKDATFNVTLTVSGENLPDNFMNSGSDGANPNALTANEFDGYLVLDDGDEPIHMAWHVLPRKSAELSARQTLTFQDGVDTISLRNKGVGVAQNDAYALIGTSPEMPEGDAGEGEPTPDLRAVGVNTFPVPAGFCSDQESFIWAFAINTWEPQQHLLPVSHVISLQANLDDDEDLEIDALVLNRDAAAGPPGFNQIGDGRQLTFALDFVSGGASAFFFAEHATDTGNTVLYICGEQIGMSGPDLLTTKVEMTVEAQDFYYGGPGDIIDGLTVTPLGERYLGIPEDVAGDSTGTMTVVDFGAFPGNSPEYGVMLVTNGDRGAGARGGATSDTEALLFTASPGDVQPTPPVPTKKGGG